MACDDLSDIGLVSFEIAISLSLFDVVKGIGGVG